MNYSKLPFANQLFKTSLW